MPEFERDIDRCLDFASDQPQESPGDRKSDIQRGLAWICANPGANRPELKLADSGWWLRRYKSAHILIVYAYVPSTGPRSRGVIIFVAVRYMLVASPTVESEKVTTFVPNPDDPDDPGDDFDWDEVVAAIEEDGDSEELAFNSDNYATEEEAMHALHAFIHEIFEEVERDADLDPALDAPGQTGRQKGTRVHSAAALGKTGGA